MSQSIKIIDYLIQYFLRHANGFENMAKDWDEDVLARVAKAIASNDRDIVKGLQLLKKTVKKELKLPNCKHPKKDIDITSEGQKYCMNCNSDL